MHARLREFCLTMIVAGAILGAADPSRAVSFRISPQDEPDPTPTPARYGEEGGLFAAASQPAPGGGETGGGGQTTDEQDTDKAAKTFASVVGQNVSSDFVAKHFSLLFGGVVLNQFKIEKPEGSADFVLEDGNTEAKAFLEAGFRYRWAWSIAIPPWTRRCAATIPTS